MCIRDREKDDLEVMFQNKEQVLWDEEFFKLPGKNGLRYRTEWQELVPYLTPKNVTELSGKIVQTAIKRIHQKIKITQMIPT